MVWGRVVPEDGVRKSTGIAAKVINRCGGATDVFFNYFFSDGVCQQTAGFPISRN